MTFESLAEAVWAVERRYSTKAIGGEGAQDENAPLLGRRRTHWKKTSRTKREGRD
jgi:hypothetical protein